MNGAVLSMDVSWVAYPDKPIRFVALPAASGSTDTLMRVVTAELSKQMGVAFMIGTMDVIKAPPDGYTFGYGNSVSLAVNRSLLVKVTYDVQAIPRYVIGARICAREDIGRRRAER